MLGISIYFLLATLVVSTYKFDNSLSLCACQPTTYQPTSFILKTLLYKEKVYAINSLGCGGVNSCLPNSYVFPIDLLTLGVAFLVLFLIINEEHKRRKRILNKKDTPKTKAVKPKKKATKKKTTSTKRKRKTKAK